MVHDYAIEPALVANLGGLKDYRYFIREFGAGTPRVMAEFPNRKNWKRQVLQATAGLGDMDLQRVEALTRWLLERTASRASAGYDGAMPWLDNAEAEHALRPFRAILARENPRNGAAVVNPGAMYESDAWDVCLSSTPPREHRELSRLLTPLLRISKEILFVEPHFDASKHRFCRPLAALLQDAHRDRPTAPPDRIVLVVGDNQESSYFFDNCRRGLPRAVPAGAELRVRMVRQRAGGEKLHDRFVLTELGAVLLGTGFDDGNPGETQTVSLIADKTAYELRWAQYAGSPSAFDVVGETTILGAA